MAIRSLKKITAIFVVIAFIGIGVAWAMEQSSPQFQEKAGTPVIKKHKKFPWLIAVLGVAAVGVGVYFLTKKKDDANNIDNSPYNVTVECLDMTSLDDAGNFVTKKTVAGANLVVDGQALAAGTYTFSHPDSTVAIDFKGAVYDSVLCVRKPGNKTNIAQTQNGAAASVDLAALGQGHEVHIELYKIPNWVDMTMLKTALKKGTAVYPNGATAYIVDDSNGYYGADWPSVKQTVAGYINYSLAQISEAAGVQFTLDTNATSGQIKCMISVAHINPSSGQSGSGVMTASDIMIAEYSPLWQYLAELMHATGIRSHPISPVEGLRPYINEGPVTLNKHGKAAIRIDYFVNPNTFL
jgi:hypothetical protein